MRELYVDFFHTSDGPWERMYTLGHANVEIRRRATTDGTPVDALVEELVVVAAAEDAAEEEEIARIARERPADSDEIPLVDLARKFGIDLDEV